MPGIDIRARTFAGVMRKSYREFKASVSSDYISALTNDLRLLSSTYISPLCLMLFVAAGMVRSLLLMLYYQPFIALCAILSAGLIAIIPFLMGKLVRKYQGRRSEALSALNAQLSEAFSGFEAIRSFGIQERINRRFQSCCEALKRSECQYYAAASFADGMGQFFSLLAQAAILVMLSTMLKARTLQHTRARTAQQLRTLCRTGARPWLL